ncbi:hypothetical protein B0H66DRAFT_539427 [Apodospora peruviana]|uniref:Homeobox domain-containing protein n=1 Tax=Apodospora peruviana TaxID=516989 RepID=A0AAE0IPT7_9PEZI|nr:hypothetical protein B0H66DRAFT_539427 [Apodospora peruviana]
MEQPPQQAASPSSSAAPSSPSPSPPANMNEQQPSSPDSHSERLPSAPDDRSSSVLGSDPIHNGSELERHPKGKRKRTAAKDKSILEAAYNSNPKPDKAARLDIVKRVSLNEKEVQIWFQNRRQNDRRKSRPLSPQEIAALRYGGMQILSSDPASYNSSFDNNSNTSPLQSMSQPVQGVSSPPPSEHACSSSSDEAEKVDDAPREPQSQPQKETECTAPTLESITPPQKETPARDPQFLSKSFSGGSVGYLANRWNQPSSLSTPSTLGRPGDDSFKLEPFPSSICSSSPSTGSVLPPPSSQSSQFRISLSLEGKAEVVPDIPSPPRPSTQPPAPIDIRPIRRPNLARSHSASSPSVTLPPFSVLTNSLPSSSAGPLLPRLARGRSRDVHAWEFCCDGENREDVLTAQAKHESSGSAIAAISLLRSTSSSSACNVSPLQPSNSAKRNAATSKAPPRTGLAKKAKLGRALSSVARLQTNVGSSVNVDRRTVVGREDAAKVKVSMLVSPSGNESDKENWSPDEDGNPRFTFSQPPAGASPVNNGRRPLPWSGVKNNPRRTTPGGRGILNESSRPLLFGGNRSNTAPAGRGGKHQKRGQSPLEIFEDSEEVAEVPNDEVERFMRGEVSPSKKGDADAVAGLLSLSQGNWR